MAEIDLADVTEARLRLVLDPAVRHRPIARAELEVLAHVYIHGGDHCGCCDCNICGECWACGDCGCDPPSLYVDMDCDPAEWSPRPIGLPAEVDEALGG